MKQEDKELLLKDLSARLPYGVKIQTPSNCWTSEEEICELKEIFKGDDGLFRIGDVGALIEYSKPYLFPMDSMTEEQKFEFNVLQVKILKSSYATPMECVTILQWCYKNHIDVSGLIPKGLANDATGLNIY